MLEVGTNSEDLVDQILDANNTVLAKAVLDDRVVGESNALLVDFTISTLVDELANCLQVWVTVGNPWLDDLEHLQGGFGHTNKDTVVDLKKSEELENLAGLWCDLVDTVVSLARLIYKKRNGKLPLDADNKDQFVLSWNVVRTILLCEPAETDLLALRIAVLLHVFLGALEDNATLLFLGLSRKAS